MQGNPLSPYLFVLAMEYLTRLLRTLKGNLDFNYHPRCESLGIIQLGFANDLLMFCRGDVVSTKLLFEYFQHFFKDSGLIANINKSSIYFGGVFDHVQHEIVQQLGFSVGTLPFKYLVVPLSFKRLVVAQCQLNC